MQDCYSRVALASPGWCRLAKSGEIPALSRNGDALFERDKSGRLLGICEFSPRRMDGSFGVEADPEPSSFILRH